MMPIWPLTLFQRYKDKKFVIDNKVQSHGWMEILFLVQNYTNMEGRDIEWCITLNTFPGFLYPFWESGRCKHESRCILPRYCLQEDRSTVPD
jgi:hypothetical protein